MGDQRRRSKSKGCQKEQEEQEEQEEGEEEEECGRVYTEGAWPLLTVHSGKRGGGRRTRDDKGEVEGEEQATSKRRRSKEKTREKGAKMRREMIR